ncbi:MAG: PA14 domain-containing protein [Archangium sp.]
MNTLLLLTLLAVGDDAKFGKQTPGLVNLKGTLYYLPVGTKALPTSFEKLTQQGVLFTDRLDVPDRSFTLGFPGVSERTEWFALVFEGQFTTETAGKYDWRLVSDDGSKLWIDDAVVIDLDGQHAPLSKRGNVELKAGTHSIRVAYFQGPATQVALQLFVTPPFQKERVFVVTDFARQVSAAFQRLGASAGNEGIRVKLDTAKLESSAMLDDVAQTLRSVPGATINVQGLTAPQLEALKRELKARDVPTTQVKEVSAPGPGEIIIVP